MSTPVSLKDFIDGEGVLLDVRSPAEFTHARIPKAINLPLFSDAERALIGTIYKQVGRQAAVEEGFKCIGPRLSELVGLAKTQVNGQLAKVYCWRGGMRSGSVAWLLSTLGIPAITLQGGYKTFRRFVCNSLGSLARRTPRLVVLGGLTGSGKTALLQTLKWRGEQVLDLEALAQHRGSSFGRLGEVQPSNEHFENEIALTWNGFDPQRIIWVEDESRLIGHCKIPDPLFQLISTSPMVVIERSKDERIAHLVELYGTSNREWLISATERIGRHLGGLRTRKVVEHIQKSELQAAVEIILNYYDRTYQFGLIRRKGRTIVLAAEEQTELQCADQLVEIGAQLT